MTPLENSLKCEKLFNLVQGIGEVLEGEIHIIDITKQKGTKTYRVYTHNYCCFDISKQPVKEGTKDPFYPFFEVWRGDSKPVTVHHAYMLIAALDMERNGRSEDDRE